MILYTDYSLEATEWVANLVDSGVLYPGIVRRVDVNEITPTQLSEFSQCHFFCGIGGWAYACNLAGLPPEFPIWTASLPCQPFSIAGSRKGSDDEQHLWPIFFRIVKQCRPPILIGEQVISPLALEWWDSVASDLERIGYATAALSLPASSIGAYHRRDRLYWGAAMANPDKLDPATKRQLRIWQLSRFEKDTPNGWEAPQWEENVPIPAIESGICTVVNGVSRNLVRCRSKRLRGYGNAIVPQLGAVFIQEFLQCL